MKILRLRGIPIHRILSDTEFVERSRKGLRLSKRLVWIHVPVLVLLFLFVPWLFGIVSQAIDQEPDGAKTWMVAGMVLGCFLGVVVVNYVGFALHSILVALDLFDFNRGTTLLVKYHDLLHEAGILEEAGGQQDQQEFGQA